LKFAKLFMFELLNTSLQEIVRKRFSSETPIQAKVIPEILSGKSCLIIAETGSGKTEAALLPIFSLWLEKRPKPVSILYITPLRALNRDLLKRLFWWSEQIGFDVSVRHGDTGKYERAMQAANPPDILIATPESLQAMLIGRKLRQGLKNIQWIVIDEIHELIGSKRGCQLAVGLERLKRIAKPAQTIGLSATLGNKEEAAQWLAPDKKVSIVDTINTKKMDIEIADCKIEKIVEIVKQKSSVLIFTNTREWAELLVTKLKKVDPNLAVEVHHSSLSREIRIKAENDFKAGKLKALVCTSSLELGIDIGSVDFVIQWASPRQVSKLIQRIGRSGHSLASISKGLVVASKGDDMAETEAIVELLRNGWFEPVRPYGLAWDVLSHQIVGLLLEYYKMPAQLVFDIISSAWPFRKLLWSDFLLFCDWLQKLGYIWLNKEGQQIVLKRRKASFNYYYQALSTIPDVKGYKVFDIVSQQIVANLDANFVALRLLPGSRFICKGQPWEVIEIEKERVVVQPVSGFDGAIPAWEGELIPVPYKVAQTVAKNRKENGRWPVPNNKTILIEGGREKGLNWAIIHICGGSLINETIGRLIAAKLAITSSAGLATDPYRIIVKWQGLNFTDIADIIKNIKIECLEEDLKTILPSTELFVWKFSHVGQRFGIIAKDANFGKGYLRRLIEAYRDSPIWNETINEIIAEKFDIAGAKEVLQKIKKGDIEIKIENGLSPLGRAGLERRYELLGPARPESEIFAAFEKRLFSTKVGLICCHCGQWVRIVEVGQPIELTCDYCSSKLIGVVNWSQIDSAKKVLAKELAKKPLNRSEKAMLQRLTDSAALVIVHGWHAVTVLAGRGIGPQCAARILSKCTSLGNFSQLLKEILRAEQNWARTRQWWD
jgi:ATP-dependent Lhr-like helicase